MILLMMVSYYMISAMFMIGGLTLWRKSVSSSALNIKRGLSQVWLIRSFAALLWTCAIVINYHLYIFGVASDASEADQMFLPFFKIDR